MIRALVTLALLSAVASGQRRPNVVLFVVDDLGWSDTSFQGSAYYETPFADRLASEGMTFTAAYSNGPNCAPSRASMMTGLLTPRHGIHTVRPSARGKARHRRLVPIPTERDLGEEFVTLAEAFRDAGYATGHFGKWHLGPDPTTQGFDVNVGGNRSGSPKGGHFAPFDNPDLGSAEKGTALTEHLTDAVLEFIDQHAGDPFFVHFSHYAVHTPIQERDRERRARFAEKDPAGTPGNAKYAAMVERVDESLGRVADKLAELELEQDTILVFTSDNGGHAGATTNAPLRGAKGMLYEGGIRVPQVVRWPGRVAAGSRCDDPVSGIDLFPTLLAACGIEVPHAVDGVDLAKALAGDALPSRDLFWHFPAYLEAGRSSVSPWRTTPASAIRRGRYKLIEFFETGETELYDLVADVGETQDLCSERPELADELASALAKWRERVGARVPKEPEPRYHEPVNIVLFLADDLGYADLGCYGQEKIRTPRLDRMAEEGLRFTDFYAGSTVCAPSRCVLLTGRHTGHAFVRGNRRVGGGQQPLPDESVTLAELLREGGYRTACIGKWGLGGPDSEGLPNRQGFDRFFGYLDQRAAHFHYPDHLWSDEERVPLEGNANGEGATYSHDLMTEEALRFLREQSAEQPFFLYVPYALPHVSLQVPDDGLEPYAGAFEETPYAGGHYKGHATPRAAYAAMVSRIDRDVGRVLDLLDERGLSENTLVLFTSDNGAAREGGSDPKFFDNSKPFRGGKRDLYEGGIRAPLIARWPGTIDPDRVTSHVGAAWDFLPTFCDLANLNTPRGLDGVSFAPTLSGEGEQAVHDALYWEFHERGFHRAVRVGSWKGVKHGERPMELYDLETDPREERDLANERVEIAARLERLLTSERTDSKIWPRPQ